jgi:hypothetical protein
MGKVKKALRNEATRALSWGFGAEKLAPNGKTTGSPEPSTDLKE